MDWKLHEKVKSVLCEKLQVDFEPLTLNESWKGMMSS
jgi:hypothetical protein